MKVYGLVVVAALVLANGLPGNCHQTWCLIPPCPIICSHTTNHPPVGCHSHSTHYNITYSRADITFNQTRANIHNMLRRWIVTANA